ncbi:YihY/virulence factor BrkB family protein [Ascidiimonas aurantiaca]|uniref:YihY/virulence factor BrkB family protein n=1 Tax=Ascidiimonas aurantiaca TaxID=1685432 RepID=UPI0030EC48B2
MKTLKAFLKNLFVHFKKANTSEKGASLAYYTAFSFIPMIIIIISVLGILFGKEPVAEYVYQQLADNMGTQATQQIEALIKNQDLKRHSISGLVVGFVTLALSASGMFNQLHNSFNDLWGIKSVKGKAISQYLRKHLTSIFLILLVGFLLLLSTLAHGFLVKYSKHFNTDYRILLVYEHLIALAVFTFCFSLFFKLLGSAKVPWKPALAGGLFTAFLFALGKTVIAWYVGYNDVSSAFGSASALILVMIWVYYTAQIIFLGAIFVKEWSKCYGYDILPE